MSVIISADATDAFSHLFMIGLASILEDADAERVCVFRWKDTLQAFELKTNDDLDIGQIAEVVHAHAKRWSQSLPLTSENDYTVAGEDDKPSKTLHATMSPRLSNLGVPLDGKNCRKTGNLQLMPCRLPVTTVTSVRSGSLRTGQGKRTRMICNLIMAPLGGRW